MLFHLAPAASAAHADVLDRAAKARHLVALKVGQADEDVRVHDRAADAGGLAEFAVLDRDLDVVRAAQAVADEDLAAGGHGPEAVEVGAVQVLQGVAAAAGVQGVAVRQERQAAHLLAQVHDDLGVVRAQEGQVSQLPKVHLDGDELARQVHVLHAGGDAEPAQLVRQARANGTAEIRKVHNGLFHIALFLSLCPNRSVLRAGARPFRIAEDAENFHPLCVKSYEGGRISSARRT